MDLADQESVPFSVVALVAASGVQEVRLPKSYHGDPGEDEMSLAFRTHREHEEFRLLASSEHLIEGRVPADSTPEMFQFLKHAKGLRSLDLTAAPVRRIQELEFLPTLPALNRLKLTQKQCCDGIGALLAACTELHEMEYYEADSRTAPQLKWLDALADSQLSWLYLSLGSVTAELAEVLSRQKCRVEVRLGEIPTLEEVAHLARVTGLKVLTFSLEAATEPEEAVALLSRFTGLEQLSVGGMYLKLADIAQIARALPTALLEVPVLDLDVSSLLALCRKYPQFQLNYYD